MLRAGPRGPLNYYPPTFNPWCPFWRRPWVRYPVENLTPRAASAMASLAGALVRAMTAGELEERLRALEDRGAGKANP